MQKSLPFLLSFFYTLAQAQNTNILSLDTVFVSTRSTVTLIFPEDVNLLDVGTEDYGAKKSGNIVLLKAAFEKAPPTSFTVQYGKTNIYHATICYKENVATIIDLRNKEIPQIPNKTRVVKDSTTNLDQTIATKRLNLLLSQPKIAYKTFAIKNEKILFSLVNMIIDEETVYLKFLLDNTSKTDYLIDFAEFIYIDENKELKTMDRKNVYPKASNNIEGVRGRDLRYLGYAIPKYNLSKKGVLEIVLREKMGTRMLKLQVPYSEILQATMYNKI